MPISNSVATQERITNELIRALRQRIVTENLVNRTLVEDQITGPEDSVKMLTAQPASVTDYDGSQGTFSNLDAASETLELDHQKNFYFQIPGGWNLKRFIDTQIEETFSEVLEQAQMRVLSEADPAKTGNANAGDVTFTNGTDDVEEKVADAAENLDQNGVSMNGRYLIVPVSVQRQIEDKISARETVRGDRVNERGFRGMFRGFEIYTAPDALFPTDGTSNPVGLYGVRSKMGYADGVVNIQVIDPLPGYAGAIGVQGLHIAGAKTAQPDAFGRFVVA